MRWSLENSFSNMGIDYVDSFLLHWPFAVERTEDRNVKFDKSGKVSLASSITLVERFTP